MAKQINQGAMVLVVMAILVLGAIPASRVGFVKPAAGPLQTNILLSCLGAVIASGLILQWKGDHLLHRLFKMAGAITYFTARTVDVRGDLTGRRFFGRITVPRISYGLSEPEFRGRTPGC